MSAEVLLYLSRFRHHSMTMRIGDFVFVVYQAVPFSVL
jgi:hypothetical protein